MENKLKIALVDDFVFFRNCFASLFQRAGYPIYLQCNNGKELIANIDKTNFPDLVFMSIKMPQMDGVETMKWLKSNYPFIKVLALTIHNEKESIKLMVKHGANGYILKYAGPPEIKTAIRTVLKKGCYFPKVDIQIQSTLSNEKW